MAYNAAAARPIRVLVDGTDWLTDAVKKTLKDQPDMQLVDDGATPTTVSRRTRVDVVVTSLQDASVQWKHRAQFFTSSGVPVLAISEDRSRVEVYDRWVIREIGFEKLAAAIREVARHQQELSAQQRTE